jgi:1-acyl-sn-glycerol-3-phosphate acyltransferase
MCPGEDFEFVLSSRRQASPMDPASPPARPFHDRPWLARVWYESIRWTSFGYMSLTGGYRVTGREHLPASGGVLLVSNHASFLDVFAVGVGCPRPLKYVARSTLFKPVIGPLMRSVGAFPIDREGGGTAGLRETLRCLKSGSVVLMFPEGTRTETGELGPVQPGMAALMRARVPVVPAGVAGTFEAWPRGRLVPRPHAIRIHFGPPISVADIGGLDARGFVQRVASAMAEAHSVAREALARDLGESPELG